MSGIYSRVQARILQKNKRALYIHCCARSLSLALEDAAQGILDSRCIRICQRIVNYIVNYILLLQNDMHCLRNCVSSFSGLKRMKVKLSNIIETFETRNKVLYWVALL